MYATVVSAHWSLCPNQIAEFCHVIMTSSHACSRVRDVIDTIDNIYLLPDKVHDDTVNFKLVVSLEECSIELCVITIEDAALHSGRLNQPFLLFENQLGIITPILNISHFLLILLVMRRG